MDFTKLKELNLSQDESLFYERMGSELPSLKHLTLKLHNSGLTLRRNRIEFLRQLCPLESLSLLITAPQRYGQGEKVRTQFPLADIVEVHGPTLRHLTLHQEESSDAALRRPMLTIDDVVQLRIACPNLTHLGLDTTVMLPLVGQATCSELSCNFQTSRL